MKRLLIICLTLLMTLSLVACGKENESTIEQVQEKEEVQETIKESEPVVEKIVQEEDIVESDTTEEEAVVVTEDVIEKKIEVDPTAYSYWVVVYDQNNNELSRTTAPYGTIVKDPDGNDVFVDTNKYFHTIVNYQKDSSTTPEPSITLPVKGDIITLNDGKQYRVLKMEDSKAFVLAMYSIGYSNFQTSSYFIPGSMQAPIYYKHYGGGDCYYAMNDWYDGLNNNDSTKPIHDAIQQVSITQSYNNLSAFIYADIEDSHYVYPLDLTDICEYYDIDISQYSTLSPELIYQLFFGSDTFQHKVWLRSSFVMNGVYCLADSPVISTINGSNSCDNHPSFIIDLNASGVTYTIQ